MASPFSIHDDYAVNRDDSVEAEPASLAASFSAHRTRRPQAPHASPAVKGVQGYVRTSNLIGTMARRGVRNVCRQARNRHDPAIGRWLHRSRDWRVFVEREVRSGSQVVLHVGVQETCSPRALATWSRHSRPD
jgi:hypothetical protein